MKLSGTRRYFDDMRTYKAEDRTYWVIINGYAYPIELNRNRHYINSALFKSDGSLDERFTDRRLTLGSPIAEYTID